MQSNKEYLFVKSTMKNYGLFTQKVCLHLQQQ